MTDPNSEHADFMRRRGNRICFYCGLVCLIVPFAFPHFKASVWMFFAGVGLVPCSLALMVLDKYRPGPESQNKYSRWLFREHRYGGLFIALVLLAWLKIPSLYESSLLHYRLAHPVSLEGRVADGIQAIKQGMTRPTTFNLGAVRRNNDTDVLCYEFEGYGLPGIVRSTAMITKAGEVFMHHDKAFQQQWDQECETGHVSNVVVKDGTTK